MQAARAFQCPNVEVVKNMNISEVRIKAANLD